MVDSWTNKHAQLWVTSMRAPEVCASLKSTKTQTVWLQQMIWTTPDFRLLRRWEAVVPLLECHRSFRKTYRPHIQTSSSPRRTDWFLMMGPIGCPETSVTNYYSTLLDILHEGRSRTEQHQKSSGRVLPTVYLRIHLHSSQTHFLTTW